MAKIQSLESLTSRTILFVKYDTTYGYFPKCNILLVIADLGVNSLTAVRLQWEQKTPTP
jgi:hypothetical protein